MNILKSAFKKLESKDKQEQLVSNKCERIYQELKNWDKKRAEILQKHMKMIERILSVLDSKVKQSEQCIDEIEELLRIRIKSLNQYCVNSVNNTDFFVHNNGMTSYKPLEGFLKTILMQESQRQATIMQKVAALQTIWKSLQTLKQQECSSQTQDSTQQGNRAQFESATLKELKSNLRYLIDCELSDLIEQVGKASACINDKKHSSRDVYLPICQFCDYAGKQVEMHTKIGDEILKLVDLLIKREKSIRKNIRNILISWIKLDEQQECIRLSLTEQLQKYSNDLAVEDFYDIKNFEDEQKDDEFGYESKDEARKKNESENNKGKGDERMRERLTKLDSIAVFLQHHELVVFDRQGFYNKKVEVRILITTYQIMYLIRPVNPNQQSSQKENQSNQPYHPDFQFQINFKSHFISKKEDNLTVQVQSIRKAFLLKDQIQFEFVLEFNLQSDLELFFEKVSAIGGCHVNKQN